MDREDDEPFEVFDMSYDDALPRQCEHYMSVPLITANRLLRPLWQPTLPGASGKVRHPACGWAGYA